MTLEITNAEASANILRFADEGRLTQTQWHGKAKDGREIACLLGSIHPSVISAAECNGDLMPMWLAELTPTLFDGIPADEIVPIARRYGALVARWDALAPEAWDRVLTRFLIRTIDEAIDGARPVSAGKPPYWPAVEAAYTQTKAALASGDKDDLRAATLAATLAAWAAGAEAPWAAAEAAALAAGAGARAAARAAALAAAAAWAAEAAARAAAGAGAAVAAAGAGAAGAAVYLRLFAFLLDQIEIECATASTPDPSLPCTHAPSTGHFEPS